MTDFDAFVDELLAEEFAAEPTLATHLGVPGHDEELPDLSGSAIRAREERAAQWSGRCAAYPADSLTPDQQIDRDLILMTLRRREILRDWRGWQRDAESYLEPVLEGIFTLFLHRLRPEPELLSAAMARLRGLPELLAAARANLDPELAAPLLVSRATNHARGAVTYLRDWLPVEAPDSADLAAAADTAATAVAEHAEWLTGFGARAHGSWVLGEERYSALLREAEGLPYGAAELHERGLAAYDALAAQLAGRARAHGGNWHALLDRLNSDAPPTLESMREEYADWTARARAFCAERGLVTLPAGERCVVAPSPPHARALTAVAFYLEPPPFTDSRVGHFFVPFTPAGTAPEQVRQRLGSNSRMSIPTTAVHEAYPGHHWHFARLAEACDRPIRKVFSSSYFIEGWALYTEQLLVEQGFYADPTHEVGQLEARLFRAARIVVDTALHMGQMTVQEAAAFLAEKVRLAPDTAWAEAVRYCAWPTQASSYLTGAIEIERMRDEWVASGGTLRDFHDRLAGSGMLPLGLAERALVLG